MKIWISEDGKKAGPFEEYQIRALLDERKVDENTPAWHENCEDGWITLKDIPSLAGLLAKEEEPDELETDEGFTSTEQTPPQQGHAPYAPPATDPQKQAQLRYPYFPVRRFFARFFDISLYNIGLMLFKASQGIDPFQIDADNPNKELLYFLPYVIIDVLLLHLFGTTPGKWLLNVKVRPFLGGRMPIGGTLMRSLRVWVLGFGMFIIWFISLPISYFFAHKLGMFLWDYPNRFRVTASALSPAKIVAYVLILLFASYLMQITLPEHYVDEMKTKFFPEK